MTLQLDTDYSTARRRMRQLLLSFPGEWKSILPSPQDESWRKVDVSGVPWDNMSELLAAYQEKGSAPASVQGPYSQPSTEEKERLLSLMAGFSELDDSSLPPEEPRTTAEDFFRGNVFTALNLAFSDPLVLTAETTDGENRLTIRHQPSDSLFLPCTVLRIPAGVEATIVEEFPDTPSVLRSGHTVVVVEAGAHLHYAQIRNEGESNHFHHVRFLVDRDARVEAGMLQAGGLKGKTFYQASISGTGGEFHGRALFAGREGQVFHLEMGVQHLADHSISSLLYKTVMADHSHSVFLGNLEIPAGLKKVNSHQLNHNLILSRRARAESRPWLVIRAEDVTAEHGATVGDLDEEALFFLQSRGMPEEEARRLMIEGFFEEVLGQMPLSEEEKEAFRKQSF